MRCPKCGFITFDHATMCSKCNTNFNGLTRQIQGTSANIKPPSLLGSVVKNTSLEPSVDDLLDGQGLDISPDSSQNDMILPEEPTLLNSEEGSIESLSLDEWDSGDDFSELDVADLAPLEVTENIDEGIPSLEPLSSDVDDSFPQLDKITADLSEIDISDLVGSESAGESESLPPLEPVSDFLEDMPVLEPMISDEADKTGIAAVNEQPSGEVDSGPADNFGEDLASILDDDSLDDIDLETPSLGDFEESELAQTEESPELPLNDILEETQTAHPEGNLDSPKPATEPIDELLSTPMETLGGSAAEPELVNVEESASEVLTNDFDLSFDDDGGDLTSQSPSENRLTLELEESGTNELHTKTKSASPPARDIPDLGLRLESDQ